MLWFAITRKHAQELVANTSDLTPKQPRVYRQFGLNLSNQLNSTRNRAHAAFTQTTHVPRENSMPIQRINELKLFNENTRRSEHSSTRVWGTQILHNTGPASVLRRDPAARAVRPPCAVARCRTVDQQMGPRRVQWNTTDAAAHQNKSLQRVKIHLVVRWIFHRHMWECSRGVGGELETTATLSAGFQKNAARRSGAGQAHR